MKKSTHIFLGIALTASLAYFTSCSSDGGNGNEGETTESTETNETGEEDQVAKNTAVCIWEELSVRETPEDKGKYITVIYLGEIVEDLGETKVDESSSKKREYMKIKLSDGTEGWTRADLMQKQTERYVVTKNTKIHQRPDILTATDDEFKRMDFVVVTESQPEWYKVKGKPAGSTWFKEGWVSSSDLSDIEEDINVVIMAKRALAQKNESKKQEMINAIISNTDLAESQFYQEVKGLNIPKPANFASGLKWDVYEKFIMGMDQYSTNEAVSALWLGGDQKPLYMMTEGINGIFYYHGLVRDIDEVFKPGEKRSIWKDRIAIFKDLAELDPLQEAGNNMRGDQDKISPRYVEWCANNMIPDPDKEFMGVKMKTIYHHTYSHFFRMMTRAYFYSTKNLNIQEETDAYMRTFEMEGENFYGPEYLRMKYQNTFTDLAEGQDYLYNNEPITPHYCIGFWLRRQEDQSIDQVWKGLQMGMNLYDKEWLDEERNRW